MEKILVHSYKGGTGKTTVALNIANILSHHNKILLLLCSEWYEENARDPLQESETNWQLGRLFTIQSSSTSRYESRAREVGWRIPERGNKIRWVHLLLL